MAPVFRCTFCLANTSFCGFAGPAQRGVLVFPSAPEVYVGRRQRRLILFLVPFPCFLSCCDLKCFERVTSVFQRLVPCQLRVRKVRTRETTICAGGHVLPCQSPATWMNSVANIELEQAEYGVVMTHGRAPFACGESNICH